MMSVKSIALWTMFAPSIILRQSFAFVTFSSRTGSLRRSNESGRTTARIVEKSHIPMAYLSRRVSTSRRRSHQAWSEGASRGDDGVSRGQREEDGTEREAAAFRSQRLNVACNDVVRTILKGNGDEDAKALRGRLEQQRSELVLPGDEMSAIFFENLLLVCEHDLHPRVDQLKGEYGRAWKNILHYVEDAGWQLTDPPFRVTG